VPERHELIITDLVPERAFTVDRSAGPPVGDSFADPLA
jgi:hypothetical protein